MVSCTRSGRIHSEEDGKSIKNIGKVKDGKDLKILASTKTYSLRSRVVSSGSNIHDKVSRNSLAATTSSSLSEISSKNLPLPGKTNSASDIKTKRSTRLERMLPSCTLSKKDIEKVEKKRASPFRRSERIKEHNTCNSKEWNVKVDQSQNPSENVMPTYSCCPSDISFTTEQECSAKSKAEQGDVHVYRSPSPSENVTATDCSCPTDVSFTTEELSKEYNSKSNSEQGDAMVVQFQNTRENTAVIDDSCRANTSFTSEQKYNAESNSEQGIVKVGQSQKKSENFTATSHSSPTDVSFTSQQDYNANRKSEERDASVDQSQNLSESVKATAGSFPANISFTSEQIYNAESNLKQSDANVDQSLNVSEKSTATDHVSPTDVSFTTEQEYNGNKKSAERDVSVEQSQNLSESVKASTGSCMANTSFASEQIYNAQSNLKQWDAKVDQSLNVSENSTATDNASPTDVYFITEQEYNANRKSAEKDVSVDQSQNLSESVKASTGSCPVNTSFTSELIYNVENNLKQWDAKVDQSLNAGDFFLSLNNSSENGTATDDSSPTDVLFNAEQEYSAERKAEGAVTLDQSPNPSESVTVADGFCTADASFTSEQLPKDASLSPININNAESKSEKGDVKVDQSRIASENVRATDHSSPTDVSVNTEQVYNAKRKSQNSRFWNDKECKRICYVSCTNLPLEKVPHGTCQCTCSMGEKMVLGVYSACGVTDSITNSQIVQTRNFNGNGWGSVDDLMVSCQPSANHFVPRESFANESFPDSSKSKFLEFLVPVQLSNIQLEKYCFSLISSSMVLRSLSKKLVEVCSNILVSTRKCCDHPYLVDGSLQASLLKNLPPSDYLDTGVHASGKLELLDKVLQGMKQRGLRAVIIFHQFIGGDINMTIGDILDDFLRQRFGIDSYERVQSGLAMTKKQISLQKFNNKERGRFVFLIENRACQPSIELSSVDAVVIFGSDWNVLHDLKALHRLRINSQFGPIKVFRLYSLHTVEEKILSLANQDIILDSNIQNFISRRWHSLLSSGANHLFNELDKFHKYVSYSESLKLSYQKSLLDDTVSEILAQIVRVDEKTITRSPCIISSVRQSGKGYTRNNSSSMKNEIQMVEENSQHFWTKLLDGRCPKWIYISDLPERARRKVLQYDDRPQKLRDESDASRRKRRKISLKAVDNLTSQPIHHAKQKEASSGERSLISQRDLHLLLKMELPKVCDILHLADDAKKLVQKFLDYIMNNLNVSRELSTLQAFELSLCWRAASFLKYKVDHRESLALVKKELHFECSEYEAELIYWKLHVLKGKFSARVNVSEKYMEENQLENQPINRNKEGKKHLNAVLSESASSGRHELEGGEIRTESFPEHLSGKTDHLSRLRVTPVRFHVDRIPSERRTKHIVDSEKNKLGQMDEFIQKPPFKLKKFDSLKCRERQSLRSGSPASGGKASSLCHQVHSSLETTPVPVELNDAMHFVENRGAFVSRTRSEQVSSQTAFEPSCRSSSIIEFVEPGWHIPSDEVHSESLLNSSLPTMAPTFQSINYVQSVDSEPIEYNGNSDKLSSNLQTTDAASVSHNENRAVSDSAYEQAQENPLSEIAQAHAVLTYGHDVHVSCHSEKPGEWNSSDPIVNSFYETFSPMGLHSFFHVEDTLFDSLDEGQASCTEMMHNQIDLVNVRGGKFTFPDGQEQDQTVYRVQGANELSSNYVPQESVGQLIYPSPITAQLPFQGDELKIEIFRISQEIESATKMLEDAKLRLKGEFEAEQDILRKKYESLVEDAEKSAVEKKSTLGMIYNKVYINQILAKEFHSNFYDIKAGAAKARVSQGLPCLRL